MGRYPVPGRVVRKGWEGRGEEGEGREGGGEGGREGGREGALLVFS